jgi:uncharacterized protein (DUF302 family)
MVEEKTALGRTIYLDTDMEGALEQVAGALKEEGFGILTEIDVKKTLKAKIDVDFRPYRILGACNPALAHRALSVSSEVGLLLPCNVTVTEVNPNKIEISIIDPIALVDFTGNPDLQSVADEAKTKLGRVADSLEENR